MNLLGTNSLHLGEFLPPLLAGIAYLYLYRRRARTLARRGQPVDRARQISFVCGALLTTLVQLPPIDGLADSLLIADMLQHTRPPLAIVAQGDEARLQPRRRSADGLYELLRGA